MQTWELGVVRAMDQTRVRIMSEKGTGGKDDPSSFVTMDDSRGIAEMLRRAWKGD